MSAWLDRRLVVVEGKGGVGRTTVTAALALAAGASGRAAGAMELGGEASLARRLGFGAAKFDPRTVARNVEVSSLSVTSCLADFAGRKLHLGVLARWIFESRPMTTFVESVPGLCDVVQLGKVENRLSTPLDGELPYDLIVLDGPATGHGLTLLASARSLRTAARVGPFADLSGEIEQLLEDRARTATVVVTLPELLPVQETLDLLRVQAAEGRLPDLIVVNQHVGPLLAPGLSEAELTRGLRSSPDLLHTALERLDRERRQDTALAVLRDAMTTLGPHVPIVTLPWLANDPVGAAALAPLVAALGASA
jgi:anion-transporting  ArsA/GET3 family ATPase